MVQEKNTAVDPAERKDQVEATALTMMPSRSPDPRPEDASETEVTMVAPARGPVKDSGEPPQKTEMTMLQEPAENPADAAGKTIPCKPTSGCYGNLQPGDRIDRCVIVKKLGQGGMGSVYLARHETLGVFRAVKILSGGLYVRGGEFIRRFIQEAKIACSINHPNIVNVLDVGDDRERNFCYIIMEYVDGGTVRDVLRKTPQLSEIDALVIVESVAEALKAAAGQNIVHRDIKPDNIMLTRRGEVKLADLGIAKNTEENVQLTKSHVMMGTPAYLAPEQAQDAHSVDVRADIYSLGATLYEMLTGQIPYPGKSTYDILSKMVSEPVPDPRSIADQISAPTAWLTMRMLAKQAKQRPASAEELLREIRNLHVIPADLDRGKCIRELLEKSGSGNYSRNTPTAPGGNTVSTWLVRHILLKIEFLLCKLPFFSAWLNAMHRRGRVFYASIAAAALILIGGPLALYLAGKSAPETNIGTDLPTPREIRGEQEVSDPDRPAPGEDAAAQEKSGEPGPALTDDTPAQPPQEQEQDRKEEELREAERKEAARKEQERLDAERKQAERKAAERREAERKQAERKAAERREAERKEAARREAERKRRAAAAARAAKPKTPPPAPVEIAVFAEITPAGAKAVLLKDNGKQVSRQTVPDDGKLQFKVPAGQYRLQVSAPGFKPAERVFPVSESRTISCVKIDLVRETTRCVLHFYGNVKLLDHLRKTGLELRVDNEPHGKIILFPYECDLPRRPHRIEIRGQGIRPLQQDLQLAADQEQAQLEFYLTEMEATAELTPEFKEPVEINVFGIWEPLKKQIRLQPFHAYQLKWRIAGETDEETVDIPELLPDSVHKIRLVRRQKTVLPGQAHYAEAEKLLKDDSPKAAIEKLKLADKEGHPEAAYLLGELAETGKGRWFASDEDALACYKRAAEPPFNHPKAQLKLAIFHEEGRGGLDRDLKTALKWYKKAAEQKNPEALYRLGVAYKNGEGDEPVDYTKAVQCFTAAAELGHAEAQYQTGYSYENGTGVPLNVNKARYWYRKAAEQGHRNAQNRGKALEY